LSVYAEDPPSGSELPPAEEFLRHIRRSEPIPVQDRASVPFLNVRYVSYLTVDKDKDKQYYQGIMHPVYAAITLSGKPTPPGAKEEKGAHDYMTFAHELVHALNEKHVNWATFAPLDPEEKTDLMAPGDDSRNNGSVFDSRRITKKVEDRAFLMRRGYAWFPRVDDPPAYDEK
jgi:hypothetical protein